MIPTIDYIRILISIFIENNICKTKKEIAETVCKLGQSEIEINFTTANLSYFVSQKILLVIPSSFRRRRKYKLNYCKELPSYIKQLPSFLPNKGNFRPWYGVPYSKQIKQNSRGKGGKYGISEEYYSILVSRPCKICGTEEKKRVCDHDHETGQVRDALCDSCNRNLHGIEYHINQYKECPYCYCQFDYPCFHCLSCVGGLLRKEAEWLEAAQDYLYTHDDIFVIN